MPQMKLSAYARTKGWTPENLQLKITRGIITARSIVIGPKGARVGIISELADEDLRERGNHFQTEHRRALGHKVGNALAPSSPEPEEQDGEDDDWLQKAMDEDDGEVLPESKPAEIPKAKKTTRKIDGKETPVTVVPPADSDPYERFRGAKTNKETFAARKLELEVGEIEGRLLDKDKVRARIVKLVSETKDALTNLPGKLAPLLVGITDVVEMETTLMKEMNRALESISKLPQTKWTEDDEE